MRAAGPSPLLRTKIRQSTATQSRSSTPLRLSRNFHAPGAAAHYHSPILCVDQVQRGTRIRLIASSAAFPGSQGSKGPACGLCAH
jgi:hypothetical protein